MTISVQSVRPKAPTAGKSRPPTATEERDRAEAPAAVEPAPPPPGMGEQVDRSV